MNIYKEIEQTIFDYETYITDIMIELYKKHGFKFVLYKEMMRNE